MPVQTTKGNIIFPDGVALEVSTDDGASYTDVGVLASGATADFNYDKIEVETGNRAKLCARAKNMTIALAPSAILSQDPEVFDKFGSTMFSYESVAGTPVAGATQDFAAGAWGYNDPVEIENQNGDLSLLTINSVTGSVDGALVSGTDYYVGQNQAGRTVVTVIDSGTVTTETQTITVDYDYTPSSGKTLKAGTSSVKLDRFWVRLRHYTDDALSTYDVEMIVKGVDLDSGMQFNFKGANEDGVFETTVAFTGNIDTSETDGEQLFELFIAAGAYVDC